jgi:hypothetical protein
MKLVSLFVLGVMAVAMSAQAQIIEERRRTVTNDPIQKPLLAAPNAAMAKDATVIKIIRNPNAGKVVTAADFTFEVLRSGPGRMVCYDLSGWPGEEPWSVECTSSDANLPRVMQNRAFAEMGAKATPKIGEGDKSVPVLSSSSSGGIRDLVLAAEKDGTRVLPEVGTIWYNLRGKSQETAVWHTFIAMPNHTAAQVGLPNNRDAGGAWLMFEGTPEAHIMVGGR